MMKTSLFIGNFPMNFDEILMDYNTHENSMIIKNVLQTHESPMNSFSWIIWTHEISMKLTHEKMCK